MATVSNHTSGKAVDVDWDLPNAADPKARIVELASQAGLKQPLPDKDPVHFELK